MTGKEGVFPNFYVPGLWSWLALIYGLTLITSVSSAFAQAKDSRLRPCECNHLKSIEKTIAEDEYLQARYAAKAAEYQEELDPYKKIGRYPSSLINKQMDGYTDWAKNRLPEEFKQKMGYAATISVSPDLMNPNQIDKKKMAAYKKSIPCRDLLDSVEAHENYHIQRTKDIESGKQKLSSAVDIAQEEVPAYEAGLQVLRKTRERLKNECQGNWKCRCNGQMYKTPGECANSCPHASLRCIAPTCLEIDPKTGKWTGKGF
jgi:hypothetical protein